jgi:hypothetical protein
MINVADKICGEYQNTCLAFNNSFFPQKACALPENSQKPERSSQTTDDNKIWRRKYEICMLDNKARIQVETDNLL